MSYTWDEAPQHVTYLYGEDIDAARQAIQATCAPLQMRRDGDRVALERTDTQQWDLSAFWRAYYRLSGKRDPYLRKESLWCL